MSGFSLEGVRVRLRAWTDDDRAAFAALNADPEVMHHFPSVLTRAESDASIDRQIAHQQEHGFCFWAAEVPGVAPFIGFIGLQRTRFDAHFTPAVEIGWRLARRYWGRGYATEGARLALNYGFETLKLPEIVSIAVPGNAPSIAVMERIGMKRDLAGDFDHPQLPADYPRRLHVLYRLLRSEWADQASSSASQ